jgi:prepilin-type N-terminal cleavage/methylation domain-containing protein
VKKRKAFTLIELLVVVAIIALLISILLPSLSRAREITKRAVCTSNAKGIGTGMKVYSNDNRDSFPITVFEEPDNQNPDITNVSFVGKMSRKLMTMITGGSDPGDLKALHPSRSLFLLVVDGTCTAKQFICPSSGDQDDDLRNNSGGQFVASQPGYTRFDFRGYSYLSYGYQLPFGAKAQPNENMDPRMVLLADKGPWFKAGGEGEDGDWTVADESAGDEPGLGEQVSYVGASTEEDILGMDNDRWRNYNSRNHSQEGQNCLFQDGHATFQKKPIVGVNFDNIFTYQSGHLFIDTLTGNVPNDETGPLTNTDSVIVP